MGRPQRGADLTNISVFGLGKLGYSLACCLGAAGNRVIGYDLMDSVVAAVNDGSYESAEPGIPERRASIQAGNFSATTSPDEAVRRSDVSMIVVPTPSNSLGGFSLRFVLDAIARIGAAIRSKPERHVVALVSTVLPGASDYSLIPALESAADRRIGSDLGYCYNPSFIALGEIVKGFEEPNYVLIGETDVASGDLVERIHRSMLRADTPIARMHTVEAEIAKIASNTYETTRVAFANMLFSLCSEVPDADVDRITGALSHRLGRRFFKGATPYGGPCWPRDNRAFAAFMDAVGVPSRVPAATDLANREHGRYIVRRVLAATQPGFTVGILGLSYKPGTHVIDCSFGIELAQSLLNDGRSVIAWDPTAMSDARLVLADTVSYATSPEECLRASTVSVIVNPMRELEAVDWTSASRATVMDPWRCLSPQAISAIGRYEAMGRGNGMSMAEWLKDDAVRESLRLLNS